MMGNDLGNDPTRRFWVCNDVVIEKHTESVEEKKFFRTRTVEHTFTVPDLGVLSKLWRYSSNFGVRLELFFIGADAQEGPEIWEMLEKGSANPFSDWLGFSSHTQLLNQLAYRPDVLGVVDIPSRSAVYGGRGMTIASIP